MDKEKTTNKVVKNEFADEVGMSTAPDMLNIAKAIGEGIASKINNVREINTGSAASVTMQIEKKAREVHEAQRRFAERLANEKDQYVDVSIPAIYKNYMPSITLSINGVTVKIPADGKIYKVHRLFADMLNVRLKRLDEKIDQLRNTQSHEQFVSRIN